MSYHKFSNLGEKFNSDLTNKVMKDVIDQEKMDRPCNCNKATLLEDGKCLYEGQCRRSMVVYDLECKLCDSHYIGKTQQYLKERTNEHFGDVWKIIETGNKNYGPNCMKTARTLQCKICMTERKEILHRFRSDKSKVMNDNSDIYSSCKCKGRFHKFGRNLHIETLRTRTPQKKVNSTRASKPKRNRFSFNLLSPRLCHPTSEEAPVTPEPASPQETPVF